MIMWNVGNTAPRMRDGVHVYHGAYQWADMMDGQMRLTVLAMRDGTHEWTVMHGLSTVDKGAAAIMDKAKLDAERAAALYIAWRAGV